VTPEKRDEIRSEAKDALARERREEPDRGEFETLPKDYSSPIYEDRPHGTNPAIFNGPCDCDECQRWGIEQRKPAMTMKDLSAAVLALVPKSSRVDISLILRTQEPRTFYPEGSVEVLAEISVWHAGNYYGVDAPTYELALDRFKAEHLPKIFPPVPEPVAPAMERLSEMEPMEPYLL
jgi:hypothetical protein